MRAVVVVAAVYGYFLIFAQFGFIELLRGCGAGLFEEKVALGAMAVAGIGGGFFAAWRGGCPRLLRIALGVAAASAGLAPHLKMMPAAVGVAVLTGGALGIATVSLAAILPAWCGVAWVGLGTGLGYAFCNVPVVFNQTPSGQAMIAAVFALVGLLAVPSAMNWHKKEAAKVFPFWGAVLLFTALVWLDSAAFFIIQHVSDLKSATWGEGLLWRNAIVHLIAAGVAGVWLLRGGARMFLAVAWGLLAVAAVAVNHVDTRSIAGWCYPAGVSLYSAALVVWPGWYSGSGNARTAGWRAAWLFAVAGWFGSANGIGMAQSLQSVPPLFVVGAGVVVLGVMVFSVKKHWLAAVCVIAVCLTASEFFKRPSPQLASAAARGRQVYLSEGCIHCHSQYVRPSSLDEQLWGPTRPVEEVLGGQPVLIGNRRQGPDLSQVGARRSEAWLKLHFINPQAFAPGSAMPSYAHLFASGKGDDLVQYLRSSGVAGIPSLMHRSANWQHAAGANDLDGKALFASHCVACHGAAGRGDGPLAHNFMRPPANLVAGPFVWSPAGENLELRVARIIKFGLPGTDMPGHECLGDAQVVVLKNYVLGLRSSR